MRCPKCAYERKKTETAPDWQCPACGIVYEKYESMQNQAQALARAGSGYRPRKEAPGGNIFKSILAFAFIGAVAYFWPGGLKDIVSGRATMPGRAMPVDLKTADFSKASIIVYSLTTCGHCTVLRQKLQANGIPFREYYVDTDQARFNELTTKLQAAGHRGGAIGTPTLDVNGRMMMNNPPFEEILRQALRT